ncbi:MAG: acyl-CoA dehydrogenase family protein [Saccharopolyspora sp.]|uniref:acyl-CoA dehydrogenase family protein n=1 Tax=Saccharopolyspora TaxID=1835 RepID=UPI00190C7978|nr:MULTISPECIES: acyl-CoA dehydrogenase family protein [unclassified Saccharopolyspora]MBK0868251.1 acyl-CoA dehydrogenase family protein [Saccharopolyspora sp. HNM0986]MBQ6641556.1 acyl-CoA dehydrogenase family protein [Saccharopolyspora sp.]
MSVAAVTGPTGAASPFELSEDQRAIQQTAREFAAEQLAPHAVQWDQDKHFPVEVLRTAGELGIGGIYVDDAYGGTGLSRFDSVLIFEALASGDPSVAAYLSIHNMVAGMIDRFGDAEQKAQWLPGLCSLQQRASYCLTEPEAGSDAAALQTRAVRDGDDYLLTGVKQFISGGGSSDVYAVMARTGDTGSGGISTFLVEAGAQGLSFGPNERKMGWNAQPTRQVLFDEVRVPASRRLGPEGIGFKIAMAGLDGGRLSIAACSLGGAQAALDKSLAYVRERSAFGSKLSEFQVLQFKLADMATDLEAARMLLWRAAWALDTRDPDATRLCAMAKRLATDAGFAVANEALQIHGGYGYLAEYGLEKIVRDLRVHQILEGTNEIMRLIISRGLLESAS